MKFSLKSGEWSRKTRNDEIWDRGIEGLGIEGLRAESGRRKTEGKEWK